ncbi:MAG TPA: glycerophosphodiester phosphodiesterase [Solirubrobacteraceae bacterium]|nr:glycerophosphodiester phosphodiesterase [Solirubrobacteraceae bacterium]
MTACERIGHGGASALARANTPASFDAALEVGVDMVEFDVRGWRGDLVLAHTVLHARWGGPVRLRDALDHLAARRFADVGLNVDVKHVGCEAALLDALRGSGLLERSLLSSQVPAVLDRLREREPRARLGISVGGRAARFSRRWDDWRGQVLAGLASRRWHALMAQHRLADAALLEQVAARGGRLYAWTVNDRRAIEALRGLGVHGIATADPRLFSAVPATAAPLPAVS